RQLRQVLREVEQQFEPLLVIQAVEFSDDGVELGHVWTAVTCHRFFSRQLVAGRCFHTNSRGDRGVRKSGDKSPHSKTTSWACTSSPPARPRDCPTRSRSHRSCARARNRAGT